jgi:gamma-glutamyl:cysteine ligase YbdK (ATP-grasp superfamily)
MTTRGTVIALGRSGLAGTEIQEHRYTIGVEEELMLVRRVDHSLARSSDAALAEPSPEWRTSISPETHASVIELATGIHLKVAEAAAELATLRAQRARRVRSAYGFRRHVREDTRRWHFTSTLAFRSRRMRSRCSKPSVSWLPHYWRRGELSVLPRAGHRLRLGADGDPRAFPRTGPALRFDSYGDYVDSLEPLIASGALSDPSFLWWDVRLRRRLARSRFG